MSEAHMFSLSRGMRISGGSFSLLLTIETYLGLLSKVRTKEHLLSWDTFFSIYRTGTIELAETHDVIGGSEITCITYRSDLLAWLAVAGCSRGQEMSRLHSTNHTPARGPDWACQNGQFK